MNLAAAPTVAAVLADGEVTDAKLAASLNLSSKTLTLPNTSVTLAQLVTAVQQSLVPAGAVQPFAMNSAPTGWLACNGDAVSRSTYSGLFSAISTTYGAGNGSTTFNLPDLRGYFVRGSGTNSDGTASGTFGAKQADALKSHTHTYGWKGTTYGGANGGNGGTWQVDSTQSTSDASTGASGETRPKNIAMLYCIKF
jgi:microcystin-dependent protein